jgi:hypothetical protein
MQVASRNFGIAVDGVRTDALVPLAGGGVFQMLLPLRLSSVLSVRCCYSVKSLVDFVPRRYAQSFQTSAGACTCFGVATAS